VGSEIEKLLGGHGGVDVAFRQNSKGSEGDPGECSLAFLATKDAESLRHAPAALAAGARVIDMSGAFRLARAEFEKWYGMVHMAPDLLEEAVYGMPALFADKIARARLVACPGCYPTAVILSLRPLEGLVSGEAVIFATSGNSGARRTAEDASNEITYAYGSMHKHVPEMHKYTGHSIDFNPVVLRSVFRGINVNIRVALSEELKAAAGFADVAADMITERLEKAVQAAYTADDQVFVVKDTNEYQFGTRDVNETNKMLIKLRTDNGYAYINALIDNLYKGAAGQAVECMNLMLGLPRLQGLKV